MVAHGIAERKERVNETGEKRWIRKTWNDRDDPGLTGGISEELAGVSE